MDDMTALEVLINFANKCGIPNKGGVKPGYGHLALANTPQLKFESKYFYDVKNTLKTLIDPEKYNIFYRGLTLKESIKNLPPKGKYFTLCVDEKNNKKLSQLCISNYNCIGL